VYVVNYNKQFSMLSYYWVFLTVAELNLPTLLKPH